MKRLMRTYLSFVLLLCLAIKFVPLSLMHSHEDHGGTHVTHEAISFHEADVNGADCVFNSADESAEDCDVCDVQQSLNHQAYTVGKQTTIPNFGLQRIDDSAVEGSCANYLLESISGRAPPRA